MWHSGTIKLKIKKALALTKLNPNNLNRVLLTFDDGPHPEFTPIVLHKLRQHGALAVFFVVGYRVVRAPDILHSILADGHLIGNHSYCHRNDGDPWFGSYLRDLQKCQRVISDVVGFSPTLFRPPHGTVSFSSMTTPRILGLTPVLWSLNTHDWSARSSSAALEAANIFADDLLSRSFYNDIIVMHDDHANIGIFLDQILPVLAQRRCDLDGAVHDLSAQS
jgi:peptidoglycan-N-acetylglucosamine deacetylase